MHIQTPLSSLHATAGSHVQHAIHSQASRMKRHISSRARIGLRGGERVGISTVSTTVKRSFNGNARSSSQVKVLARHQAGPLVAAFTMSFGRVSLSRSSASRVSLRTLTGAWRRCVSKHPSSRHGRATSETAVGGTRVQIAFGPRNHCFTVPLTPARARSPLVGRSTFRSVPHTYHLLPPQSARRALGKRPA